MHTTARDEPSTGPPPQDATPKDAMRHRLRNPDNVERYKRRSEPPRVETQTEASGNSGAVQSATVEPVIGHLKDQTRLRRFAQRGIKAATAELNLAAAVISLNRLHHARATAG